jgi:hypothetical protein
MQNNVHVVGRLPRRDVDKAKANAAAFQIANQGPLDIAVTIPADNDDRRAECLDLFQDSWIAYVTQMPDFVRVGRERFQSCRQFVVRIG